MENLKFQDRLIGKMKKQAKQSKFMREKEVQKFNTSQLQIKVNV